jgi:hypothetical protein
MEVSITWVSFCAVRAILAMNRVDDGWQSGEREASGSRLMKLHRAIQFPLRFAQPQAGIARLPK